ncbi:MAG: glycosyltransferase family 2 protein [Actinomycetes bacterium]
MGDRPDELRRAVSSVLTQQGAEPVEIVVVGNGAEVPPMPEGVRTVRLPRNEGIPGGRNRGVEACHGDVVLFLDDDGWYPETGLADHVREVFAADPRLGIVSLRISDPEGGLGSRRHVPRLRAGDPERSSEVTTFLGGACAIRREVFDRVGGYPDAFFYGHEETDLAWRALDAGFRILYDGGSLMCHPAVAPTRHAQFYRYNARNRVWLARRNLPWPLAAAYLVDWVVLTVLRERTLRGLGAWREGFVEGWRQPCGRRRPIGWATVWRMTRLGRPPLL